MSTPNPGTMAGNVRGHHDVGDQDEGNRGQDGGGQDGGGQQQATQQAGGHLSDADLQNGKLPLPDGSHTTPATAPTLDDHAEASRYGQMAGEKYDEDHPGDWNHQINRATFRHQAGKKPDPTPDHGGKGYQFDPDGLRDLINELEGIASDAEEFQSSLRAGKDVMTYPAPDPQSLKHLKQLSNSIDQAVQSATDSTTYVRQLIKSLQKTLDDYQDAEEQNNANLQRNKT